jgi:two-component system chemotaxis response regulator CheY
MSAENQTKLVADTGGVATGGGQAGKKNVMVVEDSMPLRRMLCKIIGTQGFVTVEAQDGKEALAKLEELSTNHFSLIITDLMMPVMDGATFIQQAKKKYESNLPPVIICSSRSDRTAIEVVKRLCVDGYILKPFKTETIINKLQDIFPEIKA